MGPKIEVFYGKKVTSPPGRLLNSSLFEPNTKGMYPSDKYETALLISKTENIEPLKEAIKNLMKEQFGDVGMEALTHPPIQDGDAKVNGKGESLNWAKGYWIVKAKSVKAPSLVDAALNPITEKREVYDGRNAKVSLTPKAYRSMGKPGISWTLGNVQLLPGGKSLFGSGSKPEDDFSVVPIDEGAEAF